jgi:hypothetical protein
MEKVKKSNEKSMRFKMVQTTKNNLRSGCGSSIHSLPPSKIAMSFLLPKSQPQIQPSALRTQLKSERHGSASESCITGVTGRVNDEGNVVGVATWR